MRTLRLLGRDMENGILRRCVLFILPLLFAVSQTRELHAYLIELADGNILLTNGTFADYLLFAMKGMEVYYFDPRSVFYIPIYWFAFQIGLAYFLAYYSSDDFAANARVVCLASGSRRSWWVSKLIYCTVAVVMYFAVCVLTIYLMAAAYGADMTMDMTAALTTRLYPPQTYNLSAGDLLLITLFIPMLVTLGISQLQVLAGFIITPVISFAAVCGVYVLSAYYTVWYLSGNYTMWQRVSYVVADGVNPMSGVVLAAGMLITAFAGGIVYFDNKDII